MSFRYCALRLPTSVSILALTGCLDSASTPHSAEESPHGPNTVVIESNVTHQTLEGFGAALAWYQGALVEHPRKAEIYPLIFQELGLDILRFRNRYLRSDVTDRDLNPEVEILEEATASLGRSPIVLLTSWSPPSSLKANGQEACAGNGNCTLRREGGEFVYDQFADYWYDSLEHYAAQGIVPDFVSIQNEPGFIPSSWAGCRFDSTESADYPGYDRALEAVHARLSTLESPPRLLGPEVLGIHWGKLQDFMGDLDPDLIYGVAHHLYEQGGDGVWDWEDPGPQSYVDEMWRAAQASGGKPLFQTEFQTDQDDFINGGLETAWLIHASLVEEGVSAWLYWDLVWGHSGLVSLDDDQYTVRDQYYSLRHYARFTEPGYLRVEASVDSTELRASAFVSPDRGRLVVVILNVGSREQRPDLFLGDFQAASSDVYRTVFDPGESQTWVNLGSLAADNVVVLPSESIATVVLER